MVIARWMRVVAIGLVAAGLAACDGNAGSGPAEGESSGNESAASEGDDSGMVDSESQGDGDATGTSSESSEIAATRPSSRRKRSLVEQGQRRTLGFSEAIEGVNFVPLEPASLPKGANRTVVHLIEPIEGIENAALPALRFIYDLDGYSSLILVQSVARDDLGEGVEIEVAGTPARLEDTGDALILTFERDGINVELRGNQISRPQLLEYAESLVPYTEVGAEPGVTADEGSAGGEDVEETQGAGEEEGTSDDEGSGGSESSDG